MDESDDMFVAWIYQPKELYSARASISLQQMVENDLCFDMVVSIEEGECDE